MILRVVSHSFIAVLLHCWLNIVLYMGLFTVNPHIGTMPVSTLLMPDGPVYTIMPLCLVASHKLVFFSLTLYYNLQ